MIYLFFFHDTTPTELYTLSLHDALPIYPSNVAHIPPQLAAFPKAWMDDLTLTGKMSLREWIEIAASLHVDGVELYFDLDRKSTRLNSSHPSISYAVFCLKKKNHINPALL